MRILFFRNVCTLPHEYRNSTCGHMYVRQSLWHKKLFLKIDKQTKIFIFHWVSSAFFGRYHAKVNHNITQQNRIIAIMVYIPLTHPTLHIKVPFYKWGASPCIGHMICKKYSFNFHQRIIRTDKRTIIKFRLSRKNSPLISPPSQQFQINIYPLTS